MAATAALAASPSCSTPEAPRADLIGQENRKSGAGDWQLTRLRLDRRDGYRSPWIEGYCSHQSIEAGETLGIMVSTNPPERFQIEIFRTGYYSGRGARLMTTLGTCHRTTETIRTGNVLCLSGG